jgi:hypothetical protein
MVSGVTFSLPFGNGETEEIDRRRTHIRQY